MLDKTQPGGSQNEDKMIFWTLLCLSVVSALLRPNAWPLLFVQEKMRESGEELQEENEEKVASGF